MKRTSFRPLGFLAQGLWAVPLLLAAQLSHAGLTHEYKFNDATTSTNAVDSVGGATGALYPGAAYPGDGTVALDGTSGFVYLPDDIISNYTSVTFEIWTTPVSNPVWARLFDFGTDQGGPGTGGPGGGGGNGLTWFYLCLNDGVSGSLRADINPGAFMTGPQPAPGQPHHLTFAIDAVAQTGALYDNGQQVGFARNFTATPKGVGHTFNDYIGRSQFPDSYYIGSIDEFRIYDNAVTAVQVEADYEAGSGTTSASAGTLASIQFSNAPSAIVGGKFLPSIFASYDALTNSVNITTMAGITYSSADTNVISFGLDGYFHANAAGNAVIQASYQGKTAMLNVTVNLQPATLAHRYSFSGAPGATVITDSVGGANGTLINGSDTSTLSGDGLLTLDGNASSAFVALPSGMMGTLTNATFETWVNYQNAFSDWSELWAFGTNNGSQGLVYLALVPNNPDTHKARLDFHAPGGSLFDAPTALPQGSEVCLTAVYNYSAQTASLYLGGRKVAASAMTVPLYSIPDGNNYIGQSEWYGSGDPYFNGVLDEFRIYSGVKSDLQIAIDAVAGPNSLVSDPGALLSLSVLTSTTNVDVHGQGLPIQVLANFANIAGVDVTTLPETSLASGSAAVGTIVNGDFMPQNAGSTTVTATYGGIAGSVGLTVVDAGAWPSLLHRYTFNETSGTTLHDSVGGINGVINGPVTFTGQQMVMPAGNPAPNGSGLPTAASGWVSFPANQGIVSGLPSEASVEFWAVWQGGAVWQEMFDFGAAANPGISTGGGTYFMVSPHDGVNGSLRLEWFPGGLVLTGPSLVAGMLSQVVVTHDQDRQLDKLYLNGQLVASGSNDRLWSSLPDTDNWLARDQWPDAMFNGSYADMRIWNGALTSGQVANLYASGSETIVGPTLQITAAGAQVTIKWPANATGFTLESAPAVSGGAWTAVGGTPTTVNGVKSLTVTASQTQTYFRLKQ